MLMPARLRRRFFRYDIDDSHRFADFRYRHAAGVTDYHACYATPAADATLID